ncbi:uncharacterized protein THITE_2058287 [Thermothielavioides terrestris NRRL 8126]|uniref:HD domain-containing protein n=1 Tax=Thermothielavioides terrestris (strain ATCC 38088 / NRRL 8126) TaxID=578455 RepID=G2RG52_THETT|nr:uncharacterized protein THITE_2058287 [Thermothielavioides terrestris NRRL 8126]AEO70991.1 hypothetical protein THITE_2058287 [Thermothielavioides terrestris NRRL 8126]
MLAVLFLPSILLVHARPNGLGLPRDHGRRSYATRKIANVTVVDTPIVRAALTLAEQHAQGFTYNHIMRSWLFGALVVEHNATLRAAVDLEVHAVATILHDLGWDRLPSSPFVSADRRFEVDGAIAARDFIRNHDDGKKWDDHRVQRVWDAIALHSQQSIAFFKEPDVQVVAKGVLVDFEGPEFGVTKDEFVAVTREFPRDNLGPGVNETFIWLCRTKPATTYDTYMQPWGERYVSNYTAQGHRVIDTVDGLSSGAA